MNIFDLYRDPAKHRELAAIISLGAQKHPSGMGAANLEKDIWVTELLRVLYGEGLLGEKAVAFKGGTALSKCWGAIQRFSEDIDLSIDWADLRDVPQAAQEEVWEQTTRSGKQLKLFEKRQKQLLATWLANFLTSLNERLASYGIEGLFAEPDPDKPDEQIQVHFPRVTEDIDGYARDHVLLEFGGRNRGQPTQDKNICCYLSEVTELATIDWPQANVQAFHPDYILWEKLTALHQLTTQTNSPKDFRRLARHWYDVDQLLEGPFGNPNNTEAMDDVIELKSMRFSYPGVSYQAAGTGGLRLVPEHERFDALLKDHEASIEGKFFYTNPDSFQAIADRLNAFALKFNVERWIESNTDKVDWIPKKPWGGQIWVQARIDLRPEEDRYIYSEMVLSNNHRQALFGLVEALLDGGLRDTWCAYAYQCRKRGY